MTISTEDLWAKLSSLENELRFARSSYPEGMCAFPFRLTGQGFFPGGDGIWRDEDKLAAPSNGNVQVGCVMFVGNDFGTLKTYKSYESAGYENVMTWRNLKSRILEAGIPTDLCFFTNALPGLRMDGPATGKRKFPVSQEFIDFSAELFELQMEVLRPKLVVVLGPDSETTLTRMDRSSNATAHLYTTHPYADLRWPLTRADGVEALRKAWLKASA